MAKKTFKPQNLRAILTTLLVLIVLAGAGLFYLGLNTVKTYSLEVNNRLEDATASAQQIQQLQLLKAQLSQSESLVAKTDQLFATPGNYQTQTLTDLKNYTNQTGLLLASTNFDDPTTTGSYSVTIKLKAPVGYKQLIQFLTLVEGNLPKMQVVSISLKHPAGGGADNIDVGDIKINIAVR